MVEYADIAVIDGEDIDDVSPYEFTSITEAAGNMFTLNAEAAIHGLKGYKAYFGGMNRDCYAIKSFVSQTDVHMRFYFNFAIWNSIDGGVYQCYPLQDGITNLIYTRWTYEAATGKFTFRVQFRHNGGAVTVYEQVGDISKATEYFFELHYKVGTIGIGGYEIKLNDILKASDFTTYATTNYSPNALALGVLYSTIPGAGSFIYFDDILVSTRSIGEYKLIPPETVLNFDSKLYSKATKDSNLYTEVKGDSIL